MRSIVLVFALLFSGLAVARDIAGITVPDEITVSATTLELNGAGIRTKFIFDIYVAAFYTAEKITKFEEISLKQPMRIAMHFLYDEVSADKLRNSWSEGFENNLSSAELKAQTATINRFVDMFRTVHKGDVITLDLVPGNGLLVNINNEQAGFIDDDHFYLDLLKIWLGPVPVTADLKRALLGVDQE